MSIRPWQVEAVASGRPSTIARSAVLDYSRPDEHRLVLLQGDRCHAPNEAVARLWTHVGVRSAFEFCVRTVSHTPRKPPVNTSISADPLTLIDVAEVVGSEVSWWDLLCVSTRERNRFPSVPDRRLQHLSAVESTGYERPRTIISEIVIDPLTFFEHLLRSC